VKDGEEVVFGGVSRDTTIQTTRKVPILGSIPVIGYLFGGELKAKKQVTVVETVKADCVQGCGGLTEVQQSTINAAKGMFRVETGLDQYGYGQIFMGRDQERPKYDQ
jgi:type II secretory pathway component GspD/PulD (secretin)